MKRTINIVRDQAGITSLPPPRRESRVAIQKRKAVDRLWNCFRVLCMTLNDAFGGEQLILNIILSFMFTRRIEMRFIMPRRWMMHLGKYSATETIIYKGDIFYVPDTYLMKRIIQSLSVHPNPFLGIERLQCFMIHDSESEQFHSQYANKTKNDDDEENTRLVSCFNYHNHSIVIIMNAYLGEVAED
jgi:hypothetical protein